MINRTLMTGIAAAALAFAPVLASAQTTPAAPSHASAPAKPAAAAPSSTAPSTKPAAPAHTTATKTTTDNSALYKKAQEKLHELGLYSGAVDGTRNNDYVAALKKFQTEHKLTADGRLTHATQEALKIK